MEVEFKVSGESTNLFGDGLAIWISKERAQPGPVFGSVDNFEGFALFLDTYVCLLCSRSTINWTQLRELAPPVRIPPHNRHARRWVDVIQL